MTKYFVHPSTIIDDGAEIGDGTHIWHFCHIMSDAVIGKDCVLGQNVFVAKTAIIGDRCKIQNNVSIYDGVHLADEVFIGPSAVFTNVTNPRAAVERKDEYKVTQVGKGATIGANATILCGNPIGEYAFVGAGAVVTRSVPAYALVLGAPARILGWVCSCGERLHQQQPAEDEPRAPSAPWPWVCTRCGCRYRGSFDGSLESS